MGKGLVQTFNGLGIVGTLIVAFVSIGAGTDLGGDAMGIILMLVVPSVLVIITAFILSIVAVAKK